MSLIFHMLDWLFPVLLLLLAGLLCAFLCFFGHIKCQHMKYAHIPGPPLDHFFFGHALTFLKISRTGTIHDKFVEWTEKYGPVYKLHMLHDVLIFTDCPETTKKILVSSKSGKDKLMYRGLISLFGQRFLGAGIVTQLDHSQWYKQRRAMDPAFNSLSLIGFLKPMNEYADRMMGRISDAMDSDSVANMTDLIDTFALEVLAKVAFDIDSETLDDKEAFKKAVATCLQSMLIQTRDIFFQLQPKNHSKVKAARDACKFLRDMGRQVIDQRKTALKNHESVPKDILTQILQTEKYDETKMSDEEELMVDNFVTFFIAGQETTSNQLAFCVRELARHPHVLEKLRKEVDEVIGLKQVIGVDEIAKMTYMAQILKEVLRIYPIAPLIPRLVKQDFSINGVNVPASVNVVFSPYVSGRSPKNFKDPLVFDPERFHPDAPKPYYCYFPFSLGPRNCIGQYLSQMEAKVMLAKFVQRFDFSLTPGQKFGITDCGSLKPQCDVICHIKHRD